MRHTILAIVIAFALGAAVGLALGWLAPIQPANGALADLHPDYQTDAVLMIAAAAAQDGDWARAADRLAALDVDDPLDTVAELSTQAAAAGRDADARLLAALADHLDASSPALTFTPTPTPEP